MHSFIHSFIQGEKYAFFTVDFDLTKETDQKQQFHDKLKEKQGRQFGFLNMALNMSHNAKHDAVEDSMMQVNPIK